MTQFSSSDSSKGITVPPTVIVVAGTVFIVFVAFVVFVVFLKKSKLNWYEKNLLELASNEDAMIIRYHKRDDDDDDERRASNYDLYRTGKNKSAEKASSVDSEHNDLSPTRYPRLYGSLPTLDNVSLTSIDTKEKRSQLDVSDKFFVPKYHISSSSTSMFSGLDMKKIDKELYDSSRHDCYPTDDPVLGQCGSIQLALNFDAKLNILRVSLLQATNLTGRTSSGSHNPNPQFKLTLFSPEPNAPKQSYPSKVYKDQRSPMLDDQFCFDINIGQVNEYNLQILVYDCEQYPSDECIGCCWLFLNRVDLNADPNIKTVFWLEVMPMENENAKNLAGEVMFSLSYLSKAQRLIVTVMRVRNLVAPEEMNEPPDPCVKVYLSQNGKRLKNKRTTVKKATYNPTYGEPLTFNVPKATLCEVVLSMIVYHEPHAFRASKALGKFEIPLNKCKDMWRALIRGEDSKPKWYPLEKPQT